MAQDGRRPDVRGDVCAGIRAAAEPGSPPEPSMQIGILMGTFARPTLEARLGRREGLRAGLRATEHGLRGPADDARRDPAGARRPDSPRGGRPRDHDRFARRDVQHEPPRRGASPDRAAAARRVGRGMPAAGHVEDPSVHRHARSGQHVAAPCRQRFARGLARHGRLRPRGERHRPASRRDPGLRARGEQRGRFGPRRPGG